jgi:hypothetical protein
VRLRIPCNRSAPSRMPGPEAATTISERCKSKGAHSNASQ